MNCVYKFTCKDQEVKEFYIGYTENLNRRIITHRNACKIDKHQWYKFIKDNGGFDNWVFNIIEEDCEKSRERYYYEILKPELNKQYCGRTKKEYDQSEKSKEMKKKYDGLEKTKKWKQRIVNCPHCNKSMKYWNLSKHKKKYCKNLN